MPRMPPLALVLLVPALALAMPARVKPAQATRTRPAPGTVVIYRCTDANGMLSIQNGIPCPKGQKQSREVLQAPTSVAVPVMTMPPPTPAHTPMVTARQPMSAPVIASPLPPPALFRCHTYNNSSYLSDNGQPKSRCMPLQATTGSNSPGAPSVCERQEDTCERIPDQDLCTAWTQYDREAQSLVEMGNPDIADEATRLHARTRRVLTESSCAPPAQNP